jgi:tetratricopeptide (TPR) repeat protein
VLQELGRLEQAAESYGQAIGLKPDYIDAFMNRWDLLFKKGDFEAALIDADSWDTKLSRLRSLETLYALGRVKEIYERIEKRSKVDDGDLGVAAFSSFIANKEKKNTANNFCSEPLEFLHFANISSYLQNANVFIKELIEELHNVKTIWEPSKRATRKGFQTAKDINLFSNPKGRVAQLKSIIVEELDSYYFKFQKQSCSYIQKWPSEKNLSGWHVVLKNQGHQTAHIHPAGWLSGVIYLKVVSALGRDEGAIEFSLNGENYSDDASLKLVHQPTVGDIVFFPSSLHHRTIPFTTDTDRIVVSFDLLPESAEQ